MNTALGAMLVGVIICLIGGLTFFGGLLNFKEDLSNRFYPKGNTQELVTTCQLDEKLKENKPEKWDGYFYGHAIEMGGSYVGGLPEKLIKINCNVLQKSEAELQVDFYYYGSFGVSKKTKWLPKKDFHKYYTAEELSEIVNKKR